MATQNHSELSAVMPIAVDAAGAAYLLQVSKSKVSEAISLDLLPARKYGNRVLIRVVDLIAFVDSMPIGHGTPPPQLAGRRTGRPRKNDGGAL